jgi:NADPH:quinone reductase-like Zn-dependent oxidoreductase/SAM-dependent methyltransferase/acyl carrier protein
MPELALAASANLPTLLRDGLRGGNLPSALIEHMLFATPSGARATEALAGTVEELVNGWPEGRPLRILEVGAGTGVLTRRLLAALGGWPGTLHYVVTDADAQMVPRLAAATAGRTGASARHWDPRNASAESPPGQFDLVLSMYALTRLGLDDRALSRMADAVSSGGALLSAEPEPNDAWNAAFGQRAEWWGDSVDSAFPLSPLRDAAWWTDTLTRAGLSEATPYASRSGLWPVALLTARRNRPAAALDLPRTNATIILIARAGEPIAVELRDRLVSTGAYVQIIDPPEVADGAELCAALAEAGETAPHVIVLPPANVGKEGSAGEATDRLTAALTVTKLVADGRDRANLWIVTLDAQGVEMPRPNEAALWGLGRTIANEQSQLHIRLVDLASAFAVEKRANILFDEIVAPDAEREIVWTSAGRHAVRVRGGLTAPLAPAPSTELVVTQPGLLDTLTWRRMDPALPGPGEIAVAVRAVGLNFRDVMWAMALLPEEALFDGFSGPSLGLECTGVVSAVGTGVTEFAVGDRVMALAPAALRSDVVTKAHAAVRLPDALGFAAGATIPVAHLTAVYSLDRLARLAAGEWVLIHGGAGGVGIAAIQYAQHKGAVVIATAGSNAKRAFLRNLGVDHVLDSRDLSFADDIRQLTGGRGIDVVLNSLSGEAMERSIGLLKPFGRFLELGKRDFMMDTRVGLRPLRQNISYFAVDVDRLPVERPEVAAGLLSEIAELLESGALRPLPWRAYPFAEVAEAFRLMQGAGHIGKIVLEPDDHLVPAAPGVGLTVRADRTYLITGGLSGFGLETARWLSDRGARHFALLSRRGADAPEAKDAMALFAAASIDARAFACDVADPLALGAILDSIRQDMPPLAGVIHAAMVVDDGLVADLTSERIARVLGPKLDGAVNLDRLTRDDEIDLFLLYSSATTLLGAPGQGSYVAANCALEAIARGRVSAGRPALAVAWGPIADVGFLARQEEARDALIRRLATAPMTARDALDMLPRLLASGEPVVAFAPVRWETANQVLPILGTPTYADVAAKASEISNVDLKERLSEMSASDAKDLIISLLTEEVARILSFSADRIDPLRPLSEFGMDSLMAVELRLAVETRMGIDMPLVSLSDNTSLSTIAARMVRGLTKPEAKATVLDAILRHETTAAPQPKAKVRQQDRVDAE